MAIDVKEYWTKLAKEAGLDEASTTAVLQAFSNEKVKTQFSADLMLRPDYSRAQDELATQKKAFEAQKTAFETDRGNWKTWYDGAVTKDAEREAELQKYREAYGNLDGTQRPPFDTSKFVAKEEYEGAIKRQGDAFMAVLEDVQAVQGEHFAKFGRILTRTELAELKKTALENGMKVSQAYDAWVRPQLDEKSKVEMDAKLQERYDAGARDALSKHKLPVDSRPSEPHPFFDRLSADKAPKTDKERLDDFVSAYNEPVGAKQ